MRLSTLTLCLFLSLSLVACEADTDAETDAEQQTEMETPAPGDAATADNGLEESPRSQWEIDPQPAPDVQMTTTDGDNYRFADFEGEVVVMNFWATWCGPCRVEVPDLIDMQNNLRDEGVTIVGVAVGEDEQQIMPFAEEFGINYPLVPDPDREVSDSFDGIYGLPTTIVINPEGQQVERVLGLFCVE